MLPDAATYFAPMVQTIAIISLVYSSFATIVQQDTKRLIAYSSIALYGPIYLYKNINILKQTLCRNFSKVKKFFLTKFYY
jgi:NADH:ubiquinone oxidoreductase subunit 4 (subunit M)